MFNERKRGGRQTRRNQGKISKTYKFYYTEILIALVVKNKF